MEHLNIILPSVLLLIGVMLKLLIGRPLDKKNLGEAFCELPVDIIFLAISFTIGYAVTVAEPQKHDKGFLYSILGILIAILVVALWRLSLTYLYKKGKHLVFIAILAINILISGFGIKKSIELVILDKMANVEDSRNTEEKIIQKNK